MRMILLSGGSGKRLWPLSNVNRPKQFLPVLRHQGQPESMLQRIWRQLQDAGLSEQAYFSASGYQADLIRGQIGIDATIIEEPAQRDTFPAIALAASYLYHHAGATRDEMIGVMPVDGYAGDEFFEHLRKLPSILEKSGDEMVLMGASPTEPSDKYGYIVPLMSELVDKEYFGVCSFLEKPDIITAQSLIHKGALWNCGVFAFRLGFLLDHIENQGWNSNYNELLKHYLALPKTSFDLAVVEKTKHISVLPFHGEWRDLGTWDSLIREMDFDVTGSGYISPLSQDTRIINELDIPVSIWNVPNVIVVAGPDGILVTNREDATGIKEMVGQIEIAPRFEERFWGKQTIISHRQDEGGLETVTKRVVITSGRFISYHEHKLRKEVWTIISGIGYICLDGVITMISPGDVIVVEPGMKHCIGASEGELEFIESQIGKAVSETDIIRYEYPGVTPDGLLSEGLSG
ncbi:sugar phosphate nucleotidyltransferase [Paenibacillus kyungheensis]|uniref:Sugar phosphate nucleotidyltransferase n=1 Tax=Paenibacillus kyungheensis TaxID=1452732 RepID=A0AAX3LY19_9BACL|nr:sugar phosphate nucleotidyltransferase [Paenibacillus kyungheensis]WCT54685.1 sugar phosphate nucleotidyltransferase [Paenibacillus kyungheensis]